MFDVAWAGRCAVALANGQQNSNSLYILLARPVLSKSFPVLHYKGPGKKEGRGEKRDEMFLYE